MIEVVIDSIRVSLMSPHRLVILKDPKTERYLPIWIGSCEADAIAAGLQDQESSPRPLTHDLLKSMIANMGGELQYVLVNMLQGGVFHAKLVIRQNGRQVEVDSRSSDAIAVAVRGHVPIYVDEAVMEEAGMSPDEEVQAEAPTEASDDRLSVFKDYIDSLNLDDLEDSES